MQIINFDPTLIGAGKLFPPAVESLPWIGYHATSSYYSNDIDATGFVQKKLLPVEDPHHLVTIAVRHGLDGGDVTDFLQLSSLSFTPISELALYFGRPESLGGQGLLHVTRLIDALLEKRAVELSPDEAAHLTSVQDSIARIRAVPPVIHAVNLDELKPMHFGRVSLAYHVSTAVPVERLIAKIVIDQAVDYLTIDVKGHNQSLRNLLYSPHAHYIKQIAR